VFLDLTTELQHHGVKKKVIADMFGMALRTYHRRMRELSDSRTDSGRTLWEAVLGFLRERERASTRQLQERFRHDDPEILSGVLNDLVATGLAYRAGRGDSALYRAADAADFAAGCDESLREANEYVVWLAVYRHGPLGLARVAELSRLDPGACEAALAALVQAGRVRASEAPAGAEYESHEFNVPFGTAQGWEAAVLDHFQAMVSAIGRKLALGASRSKQDDTVGGSTWSLDVWRGHPFEVEAKRTLARVRAEVEGLRQRVDTHNAGQVGVRSKQRVIFYAGQYVRDDEDGDGQRFEATEE
jgi:hypothetical protein